MAFFKHYLFEALPGPFACEGGSVQMILLDRAIQSLVDNTDVNKSYYKDLSPEEIQDMEYVEIFFKSMVMKSIAVA